MLINLKKELNKKNHINYIAYRIQSFIRRRLDEVTNTR